MAIDELSLDIGDVLQLQFLPDESQERYYVKVIGYLHERSLIVTTPHVNGKFMLIREGQALAVRLLSGNSIMAFTVNVLRSCGRPYPYLHLSYPKEMQAIMVRNAQRVNFKCQAQVSPCKVEISALPPTYQIEVEDISTGGALFVSTQPLGLPKDLLSVSLSLTVARALETLRLVSIIRNVRKRDNKDGKQEYLYGVEFQFADRQELVMLHAFVYEQIVTSAHL